MATRSSRFPLRDATIKHVADERVSPEEHSIFLLLCIGY